MHPGRDTDSDHAECSERFCILNLWLMFVQFVNLFQNCNEILTNTDM